MPTILIVEDEMLIRMHVADTFRDSGFAVVEAEDGAKALELLARDASIAAVFTDISLPGELDGFALARWIRSHRPELPVVLTSGEVTARHAEEIGRAEPFYEKPCDYAMIASYIRERLAKCGAC